MTTGRLHEIPRQPWPSRCGYCRAHVTAENAATHWHRGVVSRCLRRVGNATVAHALVTLTPAQRELLVGHVPAVRQHFELLRQV